MSKRALLIGINYFNTPSSRLYGCIFDIIQMKSLLIDIYGFAEKDIIMLRDDDPSNMPTGQRILNECATLVAQRPSYAFIHYSGHGTSINDNNGDEKDGIDECIVPCDFRTAGIIRDDDLNKILKGIQSNGIALFDSCRSGTVLDLPYELVNKSVTSQSTSGFFCFSGCQDAQTSAETFAVTSGLPQGAATVALITVLRRLKYFPTIAVLYDELKNELKGNGFEQIPNLSSSVQATSGSQFPFLNQISDDIVALKVQLTNSTEQLAVSNTTNATLKAQLTDSTAQLATSNTATATLKAQLTDSTAQLATSNTTIATLKAQLTNSTAQLATNTRATATLKAQLATSNTTIATLKAQLTNTQNQLNTSIMKVASVNSQNTALQTQALQLQKQIATLTVKK